MIPFFMDDVQGGGIIGAFCLPRLASGLVCRVSRESVREQRMGFQAVTARERKAILAFTLLRAVTSRVGRL